MEQTINFEKIRDLSLPLIPLRGKVAFPNVSVVFEAGRERTLKAVEHASEKVERLLFIVTQKDAKKDEITEADLYRIGVVCRVRQITKLAGGTIRVHAEGLYRAKIRSVYDDNGCLWAHTQEFTATAGDEILTEAYFRTAKALVKDVLGTDGKIGKELLQKADLTENPDEYLNILLSSMRVRLEIKQKILEERRTLERLKLFEKCLNDELEIAKIEKKIADSVRQSIDKNQKEYFLREQLKAIHEELGDNGKEEDEYKAKILEKHLPPEVEEKCLKELSRLSKMQPSSPEYTIVTTYLDQILELPWTEETQDTEKLSDCVTVLEADHYGLEKIKERITEYLAVLKLTGNMKAPILCFVGPPGVGKTSIASSVARALNRKFVRMSLGGVKDEAEIRGHRKTYIGAIPGRILYAMKDAGSINPVFLLDEIDKVSSDMRGDPASALLEVLDPEQNPTFRDRYLEVPYDLSKVLFITTANSLDTIPKPLLDRMEVIRLSGYTMQEKLEIAIRYLVPKQLKANGITEKQASFTKEGIQAIIEGYTLEAGVRTLERTIGSVCRKIAVKYADHPRMRLITVTKDKAIELLGTPMYTLNEENRVPEVGAVCGLAWTSYGGTTLTVEATTVAGKGDVLLTGKLGDVMKESARAALTFLHANAETYGIDQSAFEKRDVHVHVPEGATPKDGPSAGITIATAMLSVFTGKKVRSDIAMTGEITLRGNVLPIGGLKEKSLAAVRAGIYTIIIPKANERDVEEIPKEIAKTIRFIPVEKVDEVFAVAFKTE